MIPYDLGKGFNGLAKYISVRDIWFEKQGLEYVQGYLDGVGKFWRFLAKLGLPGTSRTTDIWCAENAYKSLTKK